jgi:hypothetical protein
MPTLEISILTWGQEPPAHLRPIYEAAFPPEERRQWEDIFSSRDCEHVSWLVTLSNEAIGLVIGWELPSCHYFEYLVIDPELRGQGIGSQVIELLHHKYDDELPIVLECEPAGYSPMAERRLTFYARFGLLPQPFAYRQPPYGAGLPWVDLLLLSSKNLDAALFDQITREIHRIVYKYTDEGTLHHVPQTSPQ